MAKKLLDLDGLKKYDEHVKSALLALGETTGSAYDGGKGKATADSLKNLMNRIIQEIDEETTQDAIPEWGALGDYLYNYYQEKLVSGTNVKTINGQSILGSGDITISGATGNYVELTGAQTIAGVKTFSSYVKSPYYVATGCYDTEDYIEISQLYADGIFMAVPDGEGSTSDEFIFFPAKSGTMALTSDVPYTHNIYIMPGTGAASGAYIILTLNVKGRSTAYTTTAQIASYLYSKGYTTQQNCVMASGKCSTSSSTFVGFVVGVYASSSTTLNVVYVTTGGSITSVSYATSLLTSMRDKVN